MKAHLRALAKRNFQALKADFYAGCLTQNGDFDKIVRDGITSWGEYIYVKGETFEQYLERNDLAADCKYPVCTHSYLKDGGYYSQGDIGWFGGSYNDVLADEWRLMTQDFIESIDDDDFIVMLDCHI